MQQTLQFHSQTAQVRNMNPMSSDSFISVTQPAEVTERE